MSRITTRLIVIYLVVLVFGIACSVFGFSFWSYFLSLFVLLTFTVIDFFMVRNLLRASLSVQVEMPTSITLGETVDVEIAIGSNTDLHVLDWWLPQNKNLQISEFETHNPFRKKVRAVGLTFLRLETIFIRLRSPFALWTIERNVQVSTALRVRVHPPKVQLSQAELHDLFHGSYLPFAGERRRARTQAPDIFHSFRPYRYPDSVHLIDAKKSAQWGELLVREHESFHDHHLVLCIDLSRNMSGEILGSNKSDYFISGALNIAASAMASRDRVSVIGFSDRLHFMIKQSRHLSQLDPIFEGRSVNQSREVEPALRNLPSWISKVAGTRAIVVVFSDLERASVQESFLESMFSVCHQHLTAVVGLADPLNRPLHHLPIIAQKSDVSARALSNYLYSLDVAQNSQVFGQKFLRIGGKSLLLDERQWMSGLSELYQRLRYSTYAG